MSSALKLRGVVVKTPDAKSTLLGPLDLDVEVGEHLLLVGPSGSGKTTLLRALCGLATPVQGSIELFGQKVHDGTRELVAPEARRVGYLFQGGALWPHLNVERTIAFALRHAGVPKAARRARISELLTTVELEGFEKRTPGTLSGGERQRLALARALAVDPKLLLLDEPLGPLDAHLRAELLDRLAHLHQSLGWTTIHVTHDPAESKHLTTRTLELCAGGRLQAAS